MPKILADQHPQPAEPRVECLNPVSQREETAFVEHPVGRKINFAVDVHYFSARKISGRNVKSVADVLFDEAHSDVDLAAGFQERLEDGILRGRPASHRRGQILQCVTRQGELGEYDQFGSLPAGAPDESQVFFEVGWNISKRVGNLGEGES